MEDACKLSHPATFPSSSPLLGLDGLMTLKTTGKDGKDGKDKTDGKDGKEEKEGKLLRMEGRGGKDGNGGAEEKGGEDRKGRKDVGMYVTVTKEDAALSTASSFDPETGYHASDHRPVCGTVLWC